MQILHMTHFFLYRMKKRTILSYFTSSPKRKKEGNGDRPTTDVANEQTSDEGVSYSSKYNTKTNSSLTLGCMTGASEALETLLFRIFLN